LAEHEPLSSPVDFAAMGDIARRMVHDSLESLVNQDVGLARKVREMDDELDDMHAENYRVMQALMAKDPDNIVPAVSYLTISSNLERIGDLSTNIAEEVIFMEEGEVVRHPEWNQ
ncbi:MAG: phosphate transport system regulatory protein PhoU, partial [Pseudomonadales bacterium]|nr:phosphate transport system regulatory protein PhoU [Pseudomonadales bacterium]